MFWHFGSKAALFKEACKRFFIPFWREFESSLESPARASACCALFDMYEKFVTTTARRSRRFVRWVLESPTMRESLRGELLALHAIFTDDLRRRSPSSRATPPRRRSPPPRWSRILAGNLLFSVIDPGLDAGQRPQRQPARGGGAHAVLEFANPRERVGNA